MTQIYLLLIAALQLLNLVQSNPNVTPEFRDYVIGVASSSIAIAQNAIAEQQNSTSTPVVNEEPILGTKVVEPIQITVEKDIIIESIKRVGVDGDVSHEFTVYYTENGKKVSGVEVSAESSGSGAFISGNRAGKDGKDVKKMVTRLGVGSDGGAGAYFTYNPSNSNSSTITFTASGVIKSVDISGK
jgi:hypothetical protein